MYCNAGLNFEIFIYGRWEIEYGNNIRRLSVSTAIIYTNIRLEIKMKNGEINQDKM